MKTIASWKMALLALATLLSVLFALPNVLPSTWRAALPSWLPNQPVSLGLDLRGGAHLLVEVDLNAVVKERIENLSESVRADFRAARIGFIGLRITESNAVTFRLREQGDRERALELLRRMAAPQGTALLNFTASAAEFEIQETSEAQFILTLSESALRDRASAAIQQSIEIIRRRIDETGVAEATIQRQGEDRVLVQLPGEGDPDRIKRLLGQTAKLAFRMVDISADPASDTPPPGSEILMGDERQAGPGGRYVISKRVEVAGENLVDAQATVDQMTGQPVVTFRFDQTGARRFAEVTQANLGRPFAIVLDNKVISAPVIRSPIIGGSGQIEGGFTFQQANDLAVLLRAGALPAPLKIIEERTVGPDLGADAIALGRAALLAGFALVVIYMIAAYGIFGLFANIALLLNIVMIFGILSALQATLSLPGMAGILLTLGMAVDANVLINERIREESKLGKSAILAIQSGFARAFATILDSNLTTLLAMIILFALATGPVRGFAVVISIGIVTSMFTAMLGTRLLVMLWYERRRPATLVL